MWASRERETRKLKAGFDEELKDRDKRLTGRNVINL